MAIRSNHADSISSYTIVYRTSYDDRGLSVARVGSIIYVGSKGSQTQCDRQWTLDSATLVTTSHDIRREISACATGSVQEQCGCAQRSAAARPLPHTAYCMPQRPRPVVLHTDGITIVFIQYTVILQYCTVHPIGTVLPLYMYCIRNITVREHRM